MLGFLYLLIVIEVWDTRYVRVTYSGILGAEMEGVDCRSKGSRGHTHVNLPKLGIPFFGVPIIRSIIFGGPYWGLLVLGNYRVQAATALQQ